MLKYRKEIDGLRSIAVISVIFYHAGWLKYFSGGYVGVDIFFVISGYLITSVIIREYEEKRFSLLNFYERRCRRILPALFLILFVSSLVAPYYMLLPEQLKDFGESLISIVCLSSNVYFWWKDDGYFNQLSQLNPLVHTWSLAVEEQFYFLFPLLCYLFLKKKRYLMFILISLSLISFVLCQWGENLHLISLKDFQMFSQYRFASFYLPLGRIWELLLGVFIGFYLCSKNSTKYQINSRLWKEFFSFIGFLLITLSVVYLDSQQIPPFPNLYTLLPTCGSGLIIVFGDKETCLGYFLSTRPIRWIGLISYSAYLWHQPLLAFLRLQSVENTELFKIIITIIIVFPLSVLSYLFVEQPFRNKKRFSRLQIFTLSGLASFITLIIAIFFIHTSNNQSLIPMKGGDSYLSDLKNYGHWAYITRDFDKIQVEKTFSNRTTTFNKRMVLTGDSFALDFYNMIIEGKYLKKYEIRVYFVNTYCQIYFGQEDRKRFVVPKHHQLCTNAYDIKYALPIIRQADFIILASKWADWSAIRLPTTIKLLNLTRKQKLFVIGPKDFGEVHTAFYVNKSQEFRIKQYQYPNSRIVEVNNLLEKNLDKSIYVNVLKMVCTGVNNKCPHFTPDGKLISYDGMHLTKYGAHYVGNIIFKNKPLNKL